MGRSWPPWGVHAVEGIVGHRAAVVAAAAHVTVGQIRFERHLRVGLIDLQEPAFARGEENDLAIGQVAAVEVIVAPMGQLPAAAAIQVHLEKMIKGILGDLRLLELVRHRDQVRIIAAIGEEDFLAVIGELGPEKVSIGHVRRQAAHFRFGLFEVFQDEYAAARARTPAIMLVGHMRQLARGGFDEQDGVKIQQRVAEGQ